MVCHKIFDMVKKAEDSNSESSFSQSRLEYHQTLGSDRRLIFNLVVSLNC